MQKCKTKQKTAHIQAPRYRSLDFEIKVCKSCKNEKVASVTTLQKTKVATNAKRGRQLQYCKTKQKTAHIKAPGHLDLDSEIKICQSCKSGKRCKRCKRQQWQELQKLQKVEKVQNNAKDSAYTSFRTPFSRVGDKDLQKKQKLQK